MSDLPLITEPFVLYVAIRQSNTRGEVYYGFYAKVMGIWVNRRQTEVARVRIRERTAADPESTYYAWMKTDEPDRLCLVQPSEIQFGCQFGGGYKASEKAGQGRRVNVHVEVLERFPILD